MGELRTQKNHQPAALRQHVLEFRAVPIQVNAQFTALFCNPVFIQIKHARQLAMVVAAKLIGMPGIEGAWGIP